jgi:hypothetical protein
MILIDLMQPFFPSNNVAQLGTFLGFMKRFAELVSKLCKKKKEVNLQ